MEEKRNYKVYRHIAPNSKSYIGITGKKYVSSRWGGGKGYKGQNFYNAIQKYGWNNIKHVILAKNLTLKEAIFLEKRFIKYYNTLVPNGYNLTKGGESGIVECMRKIGSDSTSSKPVICIETEEYFGCIKDCSKKMNICRTDISKCCENYNFTANGYHFCWAKNFNNLTKDEIEHIKTLGKNCKKIKCLNNNKIYRNAREILKDYPFLNISNIYKCCREERTHTRNLRFSFVY